jgi:hypothetical protein
VYAPASRIKAAATHIQAKLPRITHDEHRAAGNTN